MPGDSNYNMIVGGAVSANTAWITLGTFGNTAGSTAMGGSVSTGGQQAGYPRNYDGVYYSTQPVDLEALKRAVLKEVLMTLGLPVQADDVPGPGFDEYVPPKPPLRLPTSKPETLPPAIPTPRRKLFTEE